LLCPVYFADINGMDIPSDIDLSLISKSVANSAQLALFTHLGVTVALVNLVRKKILDRYLELTTPRGITLEISKHHLKFLYLTEHLKDNDEQSYSKLQIGTRSRNWIQPASFHTYVANKESYGPWELFRKTDPGLNPGDGALGLDTNFVSKEYFTDSPATLLEQKSTWLEWFYVKLDVKRYVPI
jgi:hypothetical protein